MKKLFLIALAIPALGSAAAAAPRESASINLTTSRPVVALAATAGARRS